MPALRKMPRTSRFQVYLAAATLLHSLKHFVQRFQKKDESQLFDEMMDYIPDTQRHKITIKKLHEAALSCVDGGAWFKRLFMVAIQATFMESTANGYISPFILNCLADVNRIKDWNWSEYVMRSLIENRTAYAEENASHFVGPLLFLMLFYVDRVRYKVQKTLREFPVIANWTTKLLRSREKAEIKGGCFGDGLPQEPIQIDIAPATHDKKVDYTSIPKTSGVPAPAAEAGAETAPEDVVNMPSFHRTIDKSMQSLSCSTVLSTHTGYHATESTQELDDFFNHPDVVKLLNDVDKQLKKRDEQLVRLEYMPSFSLGLTQMWNSSPNEDFGIGGSSKGKHMQEGKDDEARNVNVDVRTNTPAPTDVAENVVANENVDLQNVGDTIARFTNDGAENTAEITKYIEIETIRRCNAPARTKANYHASRLPQSATEVPQPQRAILAEYLFYGGLLTKAGLLEKSTLEIPTIKWGDRYNLVDSGVYLMRHIETFMGDISTKWSCGLSSKCDKQLVLLRIRYWAALINWSNNIVKDYILENADTHFHKVCANPNFKPETLLLG
ncbi:hypothetical protein OROMI_013476 [Orobanche minor]